MKFDVCALGEILIDAIAEVGPGIHITGNAGGAPANVLACAARFGKSCAFLSKAGDDSIGRWLKSTLDANGINTDGLVLSSEKNTTIAMVSLDETGNRSFSFYRNGCADVSLKAEELRLDIIRSARVFHFGSVSMTDEPVRTATLTAAGYARENGLTVSFDPNLRRNLWNDETEAAHYIREGIALADIVKLSDEEIDFLYEEGTLSDKANAILAQNPRLKLLLVTCGANGSYAFCGGESAFVPSFHVKAVDTTGAGDAFVGATLCWLLDRDLRLSGFTENELAGLLTFGNAVGALSVQKHGAIAAMPAPEEVASFLAKQRVCTFSGVQMPAMALNK